MIFVGNNYEQILVEGPDCAGKSTLINRLKNELCFDAKSLHHRDGCQFSRYLKEYAAQTKIIFDRGHISEVVYSTLWRGGNPFNIDESTVLNSIVRLQMITILALPDISSLRDRYLSRAYPQKISLAELETGSHLFEDYFQSHQMTPTIVYCSKNVEELESVVKKVSRIILGEK